MDYRPNVDAVMWFAAEIWPRIRAARPEARCLVVGQKPTQSVQALAGQAGVTVTGAVEDTRPYISGAGAYVAPLRLGGGTRFKLLEAMALGRPVISTTVGAEGFPVTSGRELLIADSPVDFAQAVLRVLADRGLGRALGEAGRAFVRAHYDWRVIVPKLETVYTGRL
jgi:glycosyltransferase involved in cell wall biosynthesis